MGDGRSKQKLA